MQPVVFGTCGHIDHGKTTLVRALTGVDCDRLPEEKRRGITLVLGFAPLADPEGEVQISFIDVPGHERLVHTMIAGAAGIDRALLVVAADEGVKPQTREHLDILAVLGVEGGVVAFNKADLLSDELVEARRRELEVFLDDGPLAGAAVIPCSATTGLGLEALRRAILDCARSVARVEPPHRPFRLAVDRVFIMPGAGTVVTGTGHWGEVRLGDELTSVPGGRVVRVRGLQVHGRACERGRTGERLALRLGGASVTEVPRGEQLLTRGEWPVSNRIALDLQMLPDAALLAEGDRVWVHLLAARLLGKVERVHPAPLAAGARGRAVVRIVRPVFAVPQDRVVLRRVSPATTLGGGEVLDGDPPRLRRKDAAALADLPRPTPSHEVILTSWVVRAGETGVEARRLAARLGLLPTGVEAPLGRLIAAGTLLVARTSPTLVVHRDAITTMRGRARAVLQEVGSIGLPLAEFLAHVLPQGARRLREFYLADLRRMGLLREAGGRVLAADASPVEDALAGKIVELYRQAGFAAPSPTEVASALNADPQVVQGLVRFLIDRRRLARVGGKWILHRELLDDVVASLQNWGVETFEVAQFKERLQLSRKLAIPILEWLDSARITRREGDRRRLLKAGGGTNPGA